MKRNEIKRLVDQEVYTWYDCELDTMEVDISLGNGMMALITKKQGNGPVCEIFDGENDLSSRLPNVCAFIEAVAKDCIIYIFEQHRSICSNDYDREMIEEWLRCLY